MGIDDSGVDGLDKLQEYWQARSSRQRAILVGTFLTAILSIWGFVWLASRPNMTMLYSGFDPKQSGEILASIEKSGTVYEIRGDSIWVPAGHRDKLRMSLAAEGLPSRGEVGYELLDGLSGFGTTSQMFDAAYWRAKEGELVRTVLALPNVESARIHLAVPPGRSFRRDVQASASVTLTTNGTSVSGAQAKALKFLVASAVPGMPTENVTIIDSVIGMVPTGEELSGVDRAAELKRNVERLMDAHVGFGNSIVEVNVELVTETETLTEQRYDPQERALISQESQELADQSSNNSTDTVSAASNLPDQKANDGETASSKRSETRQRSNFEVSKVTREVSKRPGEIKRVTVAVLVNSTMPQETEPQNPSATAPKVEIEALRDLVSTAVGYDQTRGDIVTVRALPFAFVLDPGVGMIQPSIFATVDLNSIAKVFLAGVFMLVATLFLVRPIIRERTLKVISKVDTYPTSSETVLNVNPSLDKEIPEVELIPPQSTRDAQVATQLKVSSDPVSRLKEIMKERKGESLKLLSGWIEKREDIL